MHRPTSSHYARQRRHRRLRATLHGTADRPRLVVFRSLKHIEAQLIDDVAHRTLVAVSDATLPVAKEPKAKRATAVGQALATKAKTLKISQVVFDRGGYQYHGRVKALAEAARAAGLTF